MSFSNFLRPSTRFAVCLRWTYQARAYSTTGTTARAQKGTSSGSPTSSGLPSSSCPADTILTGVNYLKGQPPLLALADDQYPEWLWTVLEPKVYPDDGPGGKAEKVRRRQENKKRIKERNFMSTQ